MEMSKRLFAQDRVPMAGERNDITHVAWWMAKFTEVILGQGSQKASYGTKSPNLTKTPFLERSFRRFKH